MYLCSEILQNLTLLDGASIVDVCVCSWSRERRLCSELFSGTIDNPNMTLHQHTSANLARPLRHTASNSVPNWLRCDHICVPKPGHFLPFPVFRIPINHVTVTHISHPDKAYNHCGMRWKFVMLLQICNSQLHSQSPHLIFHTAMMMATKPGRGALLWQLWE
jgi:hypothetical protein